MTAVEPLDVLCAGPLPPQAGGSAIVCRDVLAGLARLGHRIRVIAPVTPDAVAGAEEVSEAMPGVAVTRYFVPSLLDNAAVPPTAEYRRVEGKRLGALLRTEIAQARPDVIVVGRETFVWYVPGVAGPRGIPTVMLVHGAPSRAILDGTYPRAMATKTLACFRKMSLVVAVAAHWASRLRTLGLSAVESLPNPVDLVRFAPGPKDPQLLASLEINGSDIVVALVCHMKLVKRPLDLVAAAAKALPGNRRLVYVVVGEGEGRAAMETACRSAGLRDRFRFVGWVPHARVPEYLRLADLVVLPSEHETQALVYLETQACGRVIVASDIPGAREVIEDGQTGLLFRKGDPEALAAVILQAASDPARRTAIGQRARARVQPHALPRVVAAYADMLRRVADRRQAPSLGSPAARLRGGEAHERAPSDGEP